MLGALGAIGGVAGRAEAVDKATPVVSAREFPVDSTAAFGDEGLVATEHVGHNEVEAR